MTECLHENHSCINPVRSPMADERRTCDDCGIELVDEGENCWREPYVRGAS